MRRVQWPGHFLKAHAIVKARTPAFARDCDGNCILDADGDGICDDEGRLCAWSGR